MNVPVMLGFAEIIVNIANAVIQPSSIYAAEQTTSSLSKPYGFSYRDAFGLNKKYVLGESRFVKAKDTPFEPNIINYLMGNKNP